jgi:curli biogenesis system outer membrane secretion channel CsgG
MERRTWRGLALMLALGSTPAAWTPLRAQGDGLGEELGWEGANEEAELEPGQGWKAYFEKKTGQVDVAPPFNRFKDKDWQEISYSDYDGPRHRMAVVRFENKARHPGVPVAAIEDLLTSSLFETNRFDLIERRDLEAVLAELKLGQSKVKSTGNQMDTGGDTPGHYVTTESAPKLGRLLGAQYLVFGSINTWNPEKRRQSTGVGGRTVAEVVISIRVIDVETSGVVYSRRFTAEASDWSFRLIVGGNHKLTRYLGNQLQHETNHSLNNAVDIALSKASFDVARKIGDSPWRCAVANYDPKSGRVLINAGDNLGLSVGMNLNAYKLGKEIVDPLTGKMLGRDRTKVCQVAVKTVDEQLAQGISAPNACKGLARGDVLEFAKAKAQGR